jgi:hypothetical protein
MTNLFRPVKPLVPHLFVAAILVSMPGVLNCADSTEKRKAFLTQLLAMLPQDPAWNEWLQRTGELPPDFDTLPTLMDLPDPLQLDDNGRPVRITTRQQWERKRAYLKQMFQHYVTGRFPPPPGNVEATVLRETKDGEITIRDVLLTFGPAREGKLNVQLFVPAGSGPFPVFITCTGKRSWVEIGLRRGYMGAIVAASDGADDTELFAALYPDYDFTCLARRAWGVSRAIDYLTTLPVVDKARLVFTDHSRGGKMATWAGAFEERLAAVIGSSPVSGGAIPWRYCADRYANETLEMSLHNYPHWFHPRLRFFVGRENKLPIDMHEMVALIAPRGYLLTLGINEGEVNAWGEERGFLAARRVYELLGAKDRIGLRFRPGTHRTPGSNIEDYFDWYDTVLGRKQFPPPDTLLWNYSFDNWKSLAGESVDPASYPDRPAPNLPAPNVDWNQQRQELRRRLLWALGDPPPHIKALGRSRLTSSPPGAGPSGALGYVDHILDRPRPTAEVDRATLPFTDDRNLVGELYYRRGVRAEAKMPVVIWLHPYSYSKGYSDLPILPESAGAAAYNSASYPLQAQGYLGTDFKVNPLVLEGFAIFTYDMIGFGTRIPEVHRFYERYPRWSLMGKMVDDVRSAVDVLSDCDRIDSRRIYVMGYSLGATVGLLGAALDDRIAGAASVCGFTPLRTEKETGSLDNLAFIHGLIPRLGFFKGNEKRLPWDFDEVLSLIAPRPLMVVSPQFDQEATLGDVKRAVAQARRVYEFLSPDERSAVAYDYTWSGVWRSGVARNLRLRNLELYAPLDYNRFSNATQSVLYHWMRTKLLGAGARF